MDWKLLLIFTITTARYINAHPGIRTPPTELLEKFNEEPKLVLDSNDTKITPLLKDGRYLIDETKAKLNTSSRKINGTVDILTNNSWPLVTPSPMSRINIYDEYKQSTNYIINEFLRKAITYLLSDSFESEDVGRNADSVDTKESKDAKRLQTLANLEKLINGYGYGTIPQSSPTEQYWPYNDKLDIPSTTLSNEYYSQLYSSIIPQTTSYSTVPSILYSNFETSTPSGYFSTSKIPTTVLTDSNSTSILVKKRRRKPGEIDPADPDPFYEKEPDAVSPILTYDSGDTKNDFNQDQEGQSTQLQQHCPGVKVTLNDKVSLNLKPEIGPCNNVKLNVNNDEDPPAPPKSETIIVSNGGHTKRKRKRKRPNKTKRRKKPASFPTVTQTVPLLAQVPVSVVTSPPPVHKKKPLKFKKKKKKLKKFKKYSKWLGKFKAFALVFLKVILFFSVANPISFSFWTMLFSPLAVLIAGGAVLTMVLYPFGATLLSAAKTTGGHRPTIYVHKHRRPPYKWRRGGDFNFEPWRRSGHRIPMRFRGRSEQNSILDSIEEFLWKSIEKFEDYLYV